MIDFEIWNTLQWILNTKIAKSNGGQSFDFFGPKYTKDFTFDAVRRSGCSPASSPLNLSRYFLRTWLLVNLADHLPLVFFPSSIRRVCEIGRQANLCNEVAVSAIGVWFSSRSIGCAHIELKFEGSVFQSPSKMTEKERENHVYMAKLAEQAERYDGKFIFFFPRFWRDSCLTFECRNFWGLWIHVFLPFYFPSFFLGFLCDKRSDYRL